MVNFLWFVMWCILRKKEEINLRHYYHIFFDFTKPQKIHFINTLSQKPIHVVLKSPRTRVNPLFVNTFVRVFWLLLFFLTALKLNLPHWKSSWCFCWPGRVVTVVIVRSSGYFIPSGFKEGGNGVFRRCHPLSHMLCVFKVWMGQTNRRRLSRIFLSFFSG